MPAPRTVPPLLPTAVGLKSTSDATANTSDSAMSALKVVPAQLSHGNASVSLNVTGTGRERYGSLSVSKSTVRTLNESTLLTQFATLRQATSNQKAAKKIARNKSTIATLLAAIQSKPNFTQMIEYSIECLKNLAVDSVSIEEMLNENVIETILTVLKLNPYNERIQHIANSLMQAFAINDLFAEVLGQKLSQSANDPLVFSLRKHVEPKTLMSSCQTVSALMKHSDDSVHRYIKGGLVPSLEYLYATQEESAEVIEAANQCAAIIAAQGYHSQTLLDSALAPHILASIKHYPENAVIVEHGLKTLQSLMTGKVLLSDGGVERIAAMPNIVDTIITAIESHPDNDRLLDIGAQCLKSLMNNGDIALLLSVNTDAVTGQLVAAATKLSSALLLETNVDYVTTKPSTGIEWIVQSLTSAQKFNLDRKNDPNPALTNQLLSASANSLARVSRVDENRIYQCMQQGAVKLLVSIIDANNSAGTNADASLAALKALSSMVTREENGVYILKSGGLKVAHGLQQLFPANDKIQSKVSELESKLSHHNKCALIQIQQGSVRAMIDLIEQRSKSAMKNEGSMKLLHANVPTLTRLVQHANASGSNPAIIPGDMTSTLSQTLQTNSANSELVEKIIQLFTAMAASTSNIGMMKDSGVVASALVGLEAHSEHGTIQSTGQSLIAALSAPALSQSQSAAQPVNEVDAAMTGADSAITDSTMTGELTGLLTAVQSVSQLTHFVSQCQSLIAAGAVKRLAAAFEAAARMTATPSNFTVRTGILSVSASALHRLTKDANTGASQSVLVDGSLLSMVNLALNECNEEIAKCITPMIAILAANIDSGHAMMDDGTINGMLTLARTHHLNDQIVFDTAKTIGLLCNSDKSNIERIVEWGSAGILVDSLLTHQSDLQRTAETLKIIHTVSVSAKSIPSFLSMDTIEAIIEIIKLYSTSPEILTLACQCLAHLLITPEAAQEVGEREGNQLLVKIMREHWQEESLCEIDMILLNSLATHPFNIQQLLEPELATVELIQWMTNKYSDNTVLVEAGRRLLQALEIKHRQSLHSDGEAFNDSQCEWLIQRLSDPSLSSPELFSILTGLSTTLGRADNANTLLSKGGFSLLASLVNGNVKNESVFFAASSAMLAVCNNGSAELLGQYLARNECVQAMVSIINSGNYCFAQSLSTGDLTAAVRAMGMLKMTDSTIKQILQHNPLKTLFGIVHNTDSDNEVLPASARLLAKISNNEAGSAAIAMITNIRELIQALRRQAQERGAMAEEFLKYGVYLLGILAGNDERLREEIGLEGGVQIIVFICNIQALKLKPSFVEYGTLALANLSLNSPNNQAFIVASKGVQLLLELITLHTGGIDVSSGKRKAATKTAKTAKSVASTKANTVELLDNAMSVLCNVCHRNDSNKELILSNNGAKVLVATMLAHFDSIPLLLTACRTLGNLAYNAAATTSLILAGAVSGLVAAMTVHGYVDELLIVALRVLANLSSDYHEHTMKAMAAEGAVQAVVEIILTRACDSIIDIIIAAVSCLCNLGRYVSNAKLIIVQKGTDAVIGTMSAHRSSIPVITITSRLLHILSRTQPMELDRIVETPKLTETVNGMLGLHGQQHPIVASLCSSLTLLSYNTDNAAKLGVNTGIIATIVKIVSGHRDNSQWLCDCLPPLSALSRHQPNTNAMAGDCFVLLVSALRLSAANVNETKLTQACFALLSNLATHSSAVQSIIHTKVVQQVFQSLHVYAMIPDVLRLGLRAVENLCFTGDTVKAYLAQCRLVDEITTVMRENAKHEDIVTQCRAILEAFNTVSLNLDSLISAPLPVYRDLEIKSARQLFGDEAKTNDNDLFPDDMRNFLIAGQLLSKHSRTAPPRPRHVYVTNDLKWLIWKDSNKPLHPDNRMKVWKILGAEAGRVTEQLRRKRFGKFLAKEECAFTIHGRERTVDLECHSERERDRWCKAINALVAYRKWCKQNNAQFDKDDN